MRLFTHNNLTGSSESEGEGGGRVIMRGMGVSRIRGVRIRGNED